MDRPDSHSVGEQLPDGVRPIAADERRHILGHLRHRWPPGDGESWHPHDAVAPETEVLCLQSAWLESEVSIEEVRRRAAPRYSSFWVLGEGAPHWDTVPSSFDEDFEVSPAYLWLTPASETICTPRSLDWMAYTDHYEATYVLGRRLVDLVKELWPTWDRHIWISPFYEHPARGRDAPWWKLGTHE